jgi:O-antigen/teichoic acid export membrane protein
LREGTEPDSIGRNTILALAVRAVAALFAGALTVFLVRNLSPNDYGVYALALSVGGLLLLPADFGVSGRTARLITERRVDMAAVAAVIRPAIRLKAVGTGVVATLLIILAEPIADAYDASSLKVALWIVALAIVVQGFMVFFSVALEALGRNSIGFRLTFGESAVQFSAALALVQIGAGASGALGGRAIGYGFGAALGAILLLGILRREPPEVGPGSGATSEQTARQVGTIFVIEAAFAAFGFLDILMIGAFLDATDAGAFSAPALLIALTGVVAFALAIGLGPWLANDRDAPPDPSALYVALRIILGFQFMIAVATAVWAPSIVDIAFGSDYGQSVDVLRALGPFVVLLSIGLFLAVSVGYLGETKRRIPLALGAVAVNVLINAILIPSIGIVGCAIGTNVALLIVLVGHLTIIRRLIDLPLRRLGLSLARVSLASLAMAAVLIAFGTGKLSVPVVLIGGTLAVAAYLAVLMATGELNRSQLRTARAYASNTFGRYQS